MYDPIKLSGPFDMQVAPWDWDVDVTRRIATHRATKTAYRLTGGIELREIEAHLICGHPQMSPELHVKFARDAIVQFEWAAHDGRSTGSMLHRLARFGRYGDYLDKR